jgi:hypothetical protein
MPSNSSADWVCILDAKNIFVADFDYDLLFTGDKCRRSFGTNYNRDEFTTSKHSIATYFNIDKEYQLVQPSTSTPYFFNVQAIKAMIRYVELREARNFQSFFLDNMTENGNLKFTEFLFYSGFLYASNSQDSYYTGESRTHHFYFTEQDFVKHLLWARKLNELFCVALHRRSLPKLSKMELKLWNGFLEERKIPKFD